MQESPDRPPSSSVLPGSLGLALGLLPALAIAILISGVATGLAGSTETRYAEIAREMLARGDWVVPTLDGAPHLEKPPFTYWALMAAFSIFGVGDVAARIPGLVAAALTLWAVGSAARRWTAARDGSVGRGAAVVLATMPAFLVLSRTVLTDGWLVLCTTVAGIAVVESHRGNGRPPLRWTVALHAALGVGLLVKGPAALLTPLAGAVAAAIAARSARPLRPLVHPLGLATLVAVALPWFLIAERRLPGLFDLYLQRRSVGGVLSAEHHASPIWVIWGPVLFGAMPWIGALVDAVPVVRRRGALLAPLAAMALAAPLFFTFAPMRAPAYGLTALPFLALIVAVGAPAAVSDAQSTADRRWLVHVRRATVGIGLATVALAVGFVVWRSGDAAVSATFVATAGTASLVAVALLVWTRGRGARWSSVAAPLVSSAFIVALGAANREAPHVAGSYRALIEPVLALRAPDEEIGVAVHRDGDWALLLFYARTEARFFGYGERLSPQAPSVSRPDNFGELDELATWFRAPQRRWLLVRTTVKDSKRTPWTRLGEGPVVVVSTSELYSVITNLPLPSR